MYTEATRRMPLDDGDDGAQGFGPAVVLLPHHETYASHPKAIVTSRSYHVVTTAHIRVIRLTKTTGRGYRETQWGWKCNGSSEV
jgi:hypothetical protein